MMLYLALVLAAVYAALILIGVTFVYAVKFALRLLRRQPLEEATVDNTCYWCGRVMPETELVIGMGNELHCVDIADCLDHSHTNVVPLPPRRLGIPEPDIRRKTK